MKLAIATVLVLVPLLVSDSRGECPTTLMWSCGSDAGIPSTLAGATFGEGGVVPWNVGEPAGECAYDIVHGALEASGSGDPYYSPGCSAGPWMVDDYWIDGPPSGQPLNFEAVLLADVAITGGCGATGWIRVGNESQQFFSEASGPQSVALGLSKSVGEVFQLEASLLAGLPRVIGSTLATATLRFRGLPAGYTVVSCHGYALPTPAQSLTWGGLKAQYR